MKEMWVKNTDWGTGAEQIFDHYIRNSSLEGACVLLAIDEQSSELVGQFAFLPYLVQVREKTYKAYRPAAPIVSKDYRYFKANPFEHPVIRMYNEGVKLMRMRGDGLIFMVPNPSWLRLLKIFPQLRTGSFPLYSRSLQSDTVLQLPAGISYGPIDPCDPRVNDLWHRFRSLHPCAVVRDTRILPWKIGKGDHEVVGVERSGELIALMALRLKGNRQWLVDDLMFADCEESLQAAMTVAVNTGEVASARMDLGKVSVLTTSAMKCALESLGFEQDLHYHFPLVVQPLAEGLSPEEIEPGLWFLSAND